MTPEEIRKIADPAERARESEGFLDRGREALATVKEIRDDAIAQLLVKGRSQREVAKDVGVSPTTVAGIAVAQGIVVRRVATKRAAKGAKRAS